MKTIQLKQLAVMDLSLAYARNMGENHIKHYRVSYANLALAKLMGKEPLDLLKQHLEEEEGKEVSIEVLPTVYNSQQPKIRKDDDAVEGPALVVENIADVLLKHNPEIRKSLEKVKVNSQLYQFNVMPNPIKSRLLSPITRFINKQIIGRINSILFKLQEPEFNWEEAGETTIEKKSAYRRMLSKIKQIPYLPEWGWYRRVTPCRFLAVAFEEDDLEEATNSLLNDLKNLQKNNLIMGHLSMPSMIVLADMVGSGKNTFAMFCFLFIDDEKLMKIANIKSPLDMPKLALPLVGVKNEVFEGGINFLNGVDPKSKYKIEEVIVNFGPDSEANRKAVVENYEQNKEYVNEVAKKASQDLRKIKKVSSQSESVYEEGGKSKLMISATFEGDTPTVDRLNEKFKKS